jgi:hypothetical protein
VSATEILNELPNLSADEIDAVFFHAAALRQHAVSASPELIAAIDEADASFEREGGKPVADVESSVKSWLTK